MRWWLSGIERPEAESEPLDAAVVDEADEILCGTCETLLFIGHTPRVAARFAGILGDGHPVVCNVCGWALRTDRHVEGPPHGQAT